MPCSLWHRLRDGLLIINRATGNQMYRDWSWDAFVAINATTRVGSGFSSINDVNTPGGGGFQNVQESFFFAEVMKYSYLIHAAVSCSLSFYNEQCRRPC